MISIKFAAILIVVVVASVGIVVYAATQLMSSPNASEISNSSFPLPTYPLNQPTNTYTEMVNGFRVSQGAYANYNYRIYNTSTNILIHETKFEIIAEEGNYKEIPCWLIVQTGTRNTELLFSLYPTIDWTTQDVMTKEIRTYYLAKGNLSLLTYTIKEFHLKNGIEASNEYGPNKYLVFPEKGPENTMVVGCPGQNLGLLSYETIIISAGTFTNCGKYQYPNPTGYVWYSVDVPFWGAVKAESQGTTDQQIVKTELTSYKA